MGIKEFIQERGIVSLYHFTFIDNLDSILKYGLLSRDKLDENGIMYEYNDQQRLEERADAICVSISFPNYKMFYKCRIERTDKKWCVIELNPRVLYEKKCLFCVTNAASKSETNKSDVEKQGIHALQRMFEPEPFDSEIKIDKKYPYNPQAEVLVVDDIEVEYIQGIYFDNINVKPYINRYPNFKNIIRYNHDLFKYRSDYNNW